MVWICGWVKNRDNVMCTIKLFLEVNSFGISDFDFWVLTLWFCNLCLQTEVVVLGQLRHPHLVKLIGYCCEDEHRLLVYEYLPRGSLENQLFRSKIYLLCHNNVINNCLL
jgi:hypothetical protein